jgi:hypothetical protein
MGKMLNVMAAAAIFGTATTAFAADSTHKINGKIKSVDVIGHVITLEDGSTFKVARGVNVKRMKAGEKVTVITSKFGGAVEASSIMPAVD